ncbi:MAG: tyrosine-type recombinase/integrase [Flavobacteriaceae bacterium]|nr:tyrosine-type recombinase/integrase [Flavobacteriaceae bacterium]
MLLESFIDYLSLEKKYALHTVKAYQNDLKTFQKFLKQQCDVHDLKEVDYTQIRSWIVYLVGKEITNRSINRKISSLHTFYKYLLKIEEITINPLSKHKALKVAKKLQIPFSQREIEHALEDFNFDQTFEGVRDKLIIEMFYSTGIRRIELVQLKLSDVDFSKKNIKVLGKRNKERYLPLLDGVLKSIEEYLKWRKAILVNKNSTNLFLTKKGDDIYETLVYRIINTYFSKASTKVKKSPHILRHSFATHLLNQGADLNAVKELLGHASLAATQIYTHNSIGELKNVYVKSHPRSK